VRRWPGVVAHQGEVRADCPRRGGSVNMKWALGRWNGQRLLQLAYFDQLLGFCKALTASVQTELQCWRLGNCVLSLPVRLNKDEFVAPVTEYLAVIEKARKVAKRFGINPAWNLEAFDEEAAETAEELYGIFFEGVYVQKMPNVRFNGRSPKGGLQAGCVAAT